MTIKNTEWMNNASCLGKGVDKFFADGTNAIDNKKMVAQAKLICKSCSVNAECLSYAFNNEENFGVWGSFSSKERSSLKRIFKNQTITKSQAEKIVNKSVQEIKETFQNTIFVEGKNE